MAGAIFRVSHFFMQQTDIALFFAQLSCSKTSSDQSIDCCLHLKHSSTVF